MVNNNITITIDLVFTIIMLASLWIIFLRSGQKGWASIIPVYNLYILLKIVDRPSWWLILMLIPIVGFFIGININTSLSSKFGKSQGFAIGLIFLPFIFYPLLAFGNAKYQVTK